jgi:4-hydroxy-tetrahydrodipicolinate reductase
MIRIAVAGAAGKMGQRICTLAREHSEIELAGAFERPGHPSVGCNAGEFHGLDAGGRIPCGVTIAGDAKAAIQSADVLIDFTAVESTIENAKSCAAGKIPMVVGTTGFKDAQIEELKKICAGIAVVLAPNMSVGVNLLFKVLKDVAATLGDDYDIEIVEAHHRLKKDAPSGTAMKMAQVIAAAVNRKLDDVAVYERKGFTGERNPKEIGIQTLRGGDIVGEHTVMFAGLGERLEFTHKASSRDTFARGALRAAVWVKGRAAGFYDMQDVLGLK